MEAIFFLTVLFALAVFITVVSVSLESVLPHHGRIRHHHRCGWFPTINDVRAPYQWYPDDYGRDYLS